MGRDLIEAQLRSSLGLKQTLRASRRPRCAVVDTIVYAPASGRLAALPLSDGADVEKSVLDLDLHAEVGEQVDGPEAVFATSLAEVVVSGRNLREARAITAELLHEPSRVTTATALAT